ncbi:uncharacterized protein LOC124130918 isoform X2 [Haliotis rufescens]|uniref:uncharacterized protein LOC124130918 isoform X2 n=1 Tax=Haliotis rufescens TaxID=6454 RepID=UPI00201F29BA|nr:uncharacterized protein LOC124130918 isoform X2 [Haliotis rufescens]
MFIETLEFTIPVDLCDLFSTLKRGPRSNLEFPASVNSYGTTQDANIQVALRSNKLTFKVDGVSSNSSMISKSECKTLKLSVFDVDCSLAPAEQPNIIMSMSENIHHSVTHKRSYDFSVPVSSPAPKSRRISEPVQSRHIPQPQPQNTSRPSNNSESKSAIDPPVNVKQEPEDPDLIEIEPDSELNDIVPKKETPYMQIDFSSGVPHTQTSQAALDRLSHQQSSHSQSPASSSSSFHQNVPHVPDYAEPSTSQVHHGDQSADDFLVFQEDNDYGDDNDNEADYSNDGFPSYWRWGRPSLQALSHMASVDDSIRFALSAQSCMAPAGDPKNRSYPCPHCSKVFTLWNSRYYHIKAIHERVCLACVCGKAYNRRPSLLRHQKLCPAYLSQVDRVVPHHGASNTVDTMVVPHHGASRAVDTMVVPHHGASRAVDTMVVPHHGASRAVDTMVVPHHGASRAVDTTVVPRHVATGAIETKMVPQQVEPLSLTLDTKAATPSPHHFSSNMVVAKESTHKVAENTVETKVIPHVDSNVESQDESV